MQTTAPLPTSKALAIIAALMATASPAHAAEYWNDNGVYTLQPPPEFDHVPVVPVIEIQHDFYRIHDLCGGDPGVDGCATDTGNPTRDGAALLNMFIHATADEQKILTAALNDPRKPWIIVVPKPDGLGVRENGLTAHVRRHEYGHVNHWVHQ